MRKPTPQQLRDTVSQQLDRAEAVKLMGSTTILRGFIVCRRSGTLSSQPTRSTRHTARHLSTSITRTRDPISELLFAKVSRYDANADKNRFRVLILYVEAHNNATNAYVM